MENDGKSEVGSNNRVLHGVSHPGGSLPSFDWEFVSTKPALLGLGSGRSPKLGISAVCADDVGNA